MKAAMRFAGRVRPDVDLSATKDFVLTERFHVQFPGGIVKDANHANFGLPDAATDIWLTC